MQPGGNGQLITRWKLKPINLVVRCEKNEEEREKVGLTCMSLWPMHLL